MNLSIPSILCYPIDSLSGATYCQDALESPTVQGIAVALLAISCIRCCCNRPTAPGPLAGRVSTTSLVSTFEAPPSFSDAKLATQEKALPVDAQHDAAPQVSALAEEPQEPQEVVPSRQAALGAKSVSKQTPQEEEKPAELESVEPPELSGSLLKALRESRKQEQTNRLWTLDTETLVEILEKDSEEIDCTTRNQLKKEFIVNLFAEMLTIEEVEFCKRHDLNPYDELLLKLNPSDENHSIKEIDDLIVGCLLDAHRSLKIKFKKPEPIPTETEQTTSLPAARTAPAYSSYSSSLYSSDTSTIPKPVARPAARSSQPAATSFSSLPAARTAPAYSFYSSSLYSSDTSTIPKPVVRPAARSSQPAATSFSSQSKGVAAPAAKAFSPPSSDAYRLQPRQSTQRGSAGSTRQPSAFALAGVSASQAVTARRNLKATK